MNDSRGKLGCSVGLLAFLVLSGCMMGAPPQNVQPVQATGERLWYAMSGVPRWQAKPIQRDLNYLSISLNRVFFKGLPGLRKDDLVIAGLELEGVLPGLKSLRTVFGPLRAEGRFPAI